MEYIYNFDIFCNNFALLRRKNKLTISDISKATGISVWELLNIEVGAEPKNISCFTLLELCDYFKITLDNIFTHIK